MKYQKLFMFLIGLSVAYIIFVTRCWGLCWFTQRYFYEKSLM